MRSAKWAFAPLLLGLATVLPFHVDGAQVKTELLRADGAQYPDRVVYTWQGEVQNTRSSEARITVRLVARDSRGNPIAYLEVPAVTVPGRSSVRQEAVFELERSVWGRVYTVDAKAVSAEEGG